MGTLKQSCHPAMRQIDQNPFSITRVEEAFLKQPENIIINC